MMSAFFGALATGLTAMLICRSGSDLLRGASGRNLGTTLPMENAICWISGVASSLLFAFTNCMWTQAVIVEIYTMNAFFLMLIFLLSYRWMSQPSDKLLYVIGFIFGVSLAHYYVLLLALVPLVIVVALKDLKLLRDFCIAGAPFAAAMLLIKLEWVPSVRHPTDITFTVYLMLNCLVLALAYFFLPRGRAVAITILLAEIGFAGYIYMPLASDIRNPPINWGYPRTWQGFLHAVGRGQYEKIVPTDVFSTKFVHQIIDYFIDLRRQFTIIPELLGFMAFSGWLVTVAGRRLNALFVSVGFAALALIFAMIEKLVLDPASNIAVPFIDVEVYKLLMGAILVLTLAGTIAILVEQGYELARKLSRDSDADVSDRIMVVLMGLFVLLLYASIIYRLAGNIGLIMGPLWQPGAKFEFKQVLAMVLKALGVVALMLLPGLLGLLFSMLRRTRWQITLLFSSDTQKWFIATLGGFGVMSVALIALANPRGDIQDAFIQKVKFISSHNLYSLWIGYGLILGLAQFNALFKRLGAPLLAIASLVVAAALSFIPLYENGYDKELLKIYGGAEMNGHDFGWQFGNYQLRGANAIREELDPGEEPLPNPEFPPEMTRNPIFYGGTDPGRFVPTYMIYSAAVREDAYLITQNALADNTYMSVMRDLYGDRIWIPSPPESAMAFQRYVDEVRTGKRPKNADLTIENGRVQVSGALGVMEINGILAQVIFERNNWRHDFYVEESYVIQWMFPYLTPHGLIMKINREPVPLDPENVRNDLDFWDWYSRRLNSDSKFIRDIVARKSFSKLRSAIAGLYASRGNMVESERAFQEARAMYPLSPEANFRLVQEVLVRLNRLAEAKEVIAEFQLQDPGNDKVGAFLDQLSRFEDLGKQIDVLEKELATQGKMDVQKALRLSDLYVNAGRMGPFMQLASQILGNTNLPSIFHFELARQYAKIRRLPEMMTCLDLCMRGIPANINPDVYLEIARMYALGQDLSSLQKMFAVMEKYLSLRPEDWKAWLDLASLAVAINRPDDAFKALREALRRGGPEARALIQQNPRLAPLLQRLPPQSFGPMGIPPIPGASTGGMPPMSFPPPAGQRAGPPPAFPPRTSP
jgi:thioredoxin-like negative regulator of GroEL